MPNPKQYTDLLRSSELFNNRRLGGATQLLAILLSFVPHIRGQAEQLTYSKPPADHPFLQEVFFAVAGRLEGLHAQRKGQAAGPQLQQVDRDFAAVFKLDPSELDRLFQVIRAANVEIRDIEEQMRKTCERSGALRVVP